MTILFLAIATEAVERLRQGGSDANGQPAERRTAESDGLPCRHCLAMIRRGEPYLTLAHRPFPALQPYAEVGPIFLHAEACPQGGGDAAVPPFLASPRYILRGYGGDDRIVYGTGQITPTDEIPAVAGALLARSEIAYVHVRSASNNCFHCRIERA